MSKVKSEYEVEEILINQLCGMGYDYVDIWDYDEVLNNFRKQFCKVNEAELIAAKKGIALGEYITQLLEKEE